jgi:hypothetical protein
MFVNTRMTYSAYCEIVFSSRDHSVELHIVKNMTDEFEDKW